MKKRKKFMIAATFFVLIGLAAGQELKTGATPFRMAVRNSFASVLSDYLYSCFLPCVARLEDGESEGWLLVKQVEGFLPLYQMARRERNAEDRAGEISREEDDGHSVVLEYEELEKKGSQEQRNNDREGWDIRELLREENEAVRESVTFVPHRQRIQIDQEELKDYETLVKMFYTIDANTMAGSDQLNADDLLARDMRLKKADDKPQILIYHTHSQEAFADSVPGDERTTVVGIGERLAEILRTEYGYQVLHHKGQYDVETRDEAYGRALPELERILAENPSIEVVIDLHRDQVPEDTRLTMNLDGRPTARFMFFNGLSRTRKTGDIAYLRNDNIAGNLAFSFQMQFAAEEYYPGLTRKIYLKGYRYNMHLRPRSLLVELGAQNNTVEEAMNACEPLAHLLDLVLGGE